MSCTRNPLLAWIIHKQLSNILIEPTQNFTRLIRHDTHSTDSSSFFSFHKKQHFQTNTCALLIHFPFSLHETTLLKTIVVKDNCLLWAVSRQFLLYACSNSISHPTNRVLQRNDHVSNWAANQQQIGFDRWWTDEKSGKTGPKIAWNS